MPKGVYFSYSTEAISTHVTTSRARSANATSASEFYEAMRVFSNFLTVVGVFPVLSQVMLVEKIFIRALYVAV